MKEIDLKHYLERYKNKSVDFYRFPGNYGDSLIWHGTRKLLSDLNIEPRAVDVSFSVYNDTLFIDGGGNFNDYYSDVRNFLIKKGNLYKKIVILPHTIFGKRQIDVLNNLQGKVIVFCREKVSADFVSRNTKSAEVYIWHDCAFYNDFVSKNKGKGLLNVFRSDRESIIDKIPESNNDLSLAGYAQKPLDELINTLERYEEIKTDRLHIAIASTLLDKKVTLYSNSYFKNKAVYDYSLKKYENIKFVENELIGIYQLNFSLISKIFKTFLSNESEEILYKKDIENLIHNLIKINKMIWGLEDSARMHELGDKHVATAKKHIDKNNQARNDLIEEIDTQITTQISICSDPQEQLYSESPGMIIDRLAILYIKLPIIKDLLSVIKEADLLKEYKTKESIISRQIGTLGDFLDSYFEKLKYKEISFEVQHPVKIYNDNRIKRYIESLKQNKQI